MKKLPAPGEHQTKFIADAIEREIARRLFQKEEGNEHQAQTQDHEEAR